MRVGVVGVGGVGGQIAGRLIGAGVETVVIARGAHLAAIRDRGLTLREPEGAATRRPALAADDPAQAGPCDAVLLAVKSQELAALDLRPLLAAETPVVPFLNGVEAPDRIDAALGPGRSLIGVARISATITAPGEVTRHSGFARFEISERSGVRTPRLTALAEALTAAGLTVALPENPLRALWLKFLMLGPFSGVTALARCDNATMLANPLLSALYRRLAEETAAVGRAEGVALNEGDVDAVVEVRRTLPPDMRASLCWDLTAGKPLETEWLAGAVCRLGDRHGIDTPSNDAVRAALSPYEKGA